MRLGGARVGAKPSFLLNSPPEAFPKADYGAHSPWTDRPAPYRSGGEPGEAGRRMQRRPDILQRFGQRVRELRKRAGLSQEAFADKCGLDRTYMGGIERGERNVALRNISRIAEALGISLSELMDGV